MTDTGFLSFRNLHSVPYNVPKSTS